MSKASKALLQLIPVAVATGYAAYVIQDRFEFHDQVREGKIRKRKEQQAKNAAGRGTWKESACAERRQRCLSSPR